MECTTETAEATEDSGLEDRVAEENFEASPEGTNDKVDAPPKNNKEAMYSASKKNTKKSGRDNVSDNDERTSPIKYYTKNSGSNPDSYSGTKRQYHSGTDQLQTARSSRSSGDVSNPRTLDQVVGRRENYDTYDGAVAILYHKDPKTGVVYFSVEILSDHLNPNVRDKIALPGGKLQIGESPPNGLLREIKEEDPDSNIILTKALKGDGRKIYEIRYFNNNVSGINYIWAAEIKDPSEWKFHKSTKRTEGEKAILSLEEILWLLATNRGAFAYRYDEVFEHLLLTTFEAEIRNIYSKPDSKVLLKTQTMPSYEPSKFLEYKPTAYTSDVFYNRSIPTNLMHASLNGLKFN